MKRRVFMVALLLVTACKTSPTPPSGGIEGPTKTSAAAPIPSNAPAKPRYTFDGGSIGTVGGGGTLQYTFKNAAADAADTLEKIGKATYEFSEDARLLHFFQRNQPRWVEALQRFSTDASIIIEVGDKLEEDDKQVGALAYPPEKPEKVLLSVPYLTTREGFPYEKAFTLAIHEAGHFAVPSMTEEEHSYLDQIAVLVLKARHANKVNTLTLFKNAAVQGAAPSTQVFLPKNVPGKKIAYGITKDGSIFYVVTELRKHYSKYEHTIFRFNLRTGDIHTETIASEWDFRWLGKDTFLQTKGKTAIYRNIGSQERHEFTLERELRECASYWMDTETSRLFYTVPGKVGQVELYSLTTDGKSQIMRFPKLAATEKVERLRANPNLKRKEMDSKDSLNSLLMQLKDYDYSKGSISPVGISTNGKYVFENFEGSLLVYSNVTGERMATIPYAEVTHGYDGDVVWIKESKPRLEKPRYGRLDLATGKLDWIYSGYDALDEEYLDEARLKQPYISYRDEWWTRVHLAIKDYTPGARENNYIYPYVPHMYPGQSREDYYGPRNFIPFAGSESSVAILSQFMGYHDASHHRYSLQWVDFKTHLSQFYDFPAELRPVSWKGVGTADGNLMATELNDGSYMLVLFR